jgi:pimeloyl-ACP methyl ester carboxylesterase
VITATTSWTGTYALPASAAPVAIVVRVHRGTATVALGPGHAQSQDVSVVVHGTRVRFAIPGLPQPVAFEGTIKGSSLAGSVRQGTLRGRFSLRRGFSRVVGVLGAYRNAGGAAVAVLEADGLAPFVVELPSGATHGLGASLTVGDRLGATHGNGSLVVDPTGFTWKGMRYARVGLRQKELRVGGDAATLTLPPGAGPFPAVVMVHGSGMRTRDEFDIFTAYFALNGIAVLADDKRGVGESGGSFPGDAAGIDVLARDAEAEVRFLARQPQIDTARIGLFGDSQAGWIVPLVASREADVHWAILNAGPTVTVGESDLWGSLAGESLSRPSGTRPQMLADLRQAGPSGFDPLPYLRKLSIPVLWMYGSDDRNVPTELCLERLASVEAGHDYTAVVLPTAHTPLVLPTGLLSSLPQSPGLDPRFFPELGDWLAHEHLRSSASRRRSSATGPRVVSRDDASR